jgi:hypothetical protein
MYHPTIIREIKTIDEEKRKIGDDYFAIWIIKAI